MAEPDFKKALDYVNKQTNNGELPAGIILSPQMNVNHCYLKLAEGNMRLADLNANVVLKAESQERYINWLLALLGRVGGRHEDVMEYIEAEIKRTHKENNHAIDFVRTAAREEKNRCVGQIQATKETGQ